VCVCAVAGIADLARLHRSQPKETELHRVLYSQRMRPRKAAGLRCLALSLASMSLGLAQRAEGVDTSEDALARVHALVDVSKEQRERGDLRAARATLSQASSLIESAGAATLPLAAALDALGGGLLATSPRATGRCAKHDRAPR
jgi:hypothetical protein